MPAGVFSYAISQRYSITWHKRYSIQASEFFGDQEGAGGLKDDIWTVGAFRFVVLELLSLEIFGFGGACFFPCVLFFGRGHIAKGLLSGGEREV